MPLEISNGFYKGYSDWRLPTKRELESLVEYQCYEPAINTAAFPATPNYVWSGSPYADSFDSAWNVGFNSGTLYYGNRYYYYAPVRLVRGGQSFSLLPDQAPQSCNAGATALDAEFELHADGTTTHSRTGLIWDRCVWGVTGENCEIGSAGEYNWYEAQQQAVLANQQNYKGYSDWRLPSIEELVTVTEETCYEPAINTTAFPATLRDDAVWSSSPDPVGLNAAWHMDFYSGSASPYFRTFDNHVRLVRNEQSFGPLPAPSTDFSLRLNQTGNGTINGSGNFTTGASVNLTAIPAAGYTFSGWSPSPCANSFTMPSSDLTCTATFTQQTCNYSITPSSRSHTSEAVSDSINITASRSDCAWSASSNANWASLSQSRGTGSGNISYSLQANTGTQTRNASLSIAGRTFSLNQAAPVQAACTYTLSPSNASHPAQSSTGSLSINTADHCAWTVSEAESWLSITSGRSGTGSGVIQYSLTANSNQTNRNGALSIAGYSFPIQQVGAADCLSITPFNYDFGAVVPNQFTDKRLHVTNSCQNNLTINLAAITGTAEFGLSNDQCSSRNLSYQQSCTVDARFRPSREGEQISHLVVQYGAGKTAQATLRGTGSGLPPVACIHPIQTNGLNVTLDGACSTDSNGRIVQYDWRISSNVSPTVMRSNHLPSDSFSFSAPGDYTAQLTVTDDDGTTATASAPFRLDYSIRLDNISVRCHIQPNPKTAIAGFVIEGTGTKTVLLRGMAVPSMSPSLDLRLSLQKLVNNTWQEILTNDNWMQSSRAAEIRNLASNLVPRSTADAALLVDLEPGVYTLIAAPQGASGIGVVSADDLDSAKPSSRLVNISGRCAVEDGNGNAIAGFVVEGEGSLNTLLRGARTTSQALSGELDPWLELVQIYPGSSQAEFLAKNDNCQDQGESIMLSALPSHLQARDYRDACILRDLPVGIFTVLMKPNAEHGIGVVSVDVVE